MTDSEFMKSTSSGPRVGDLYQAVIPNLLEDQVMEDERCKVDWIPLSAADDQTPSYRPQHLEMYCEIARICRHVTADVALKHLYERDFNLLAALKDFELLPIPDSIKWTPDELFMLVDKLYNKKKVVVIQKQVRFLIADKF